MSSVSQTGVFNVQEFTATGALAAGYRVYTYTQGTTTKKTAYTDAAGSVAHTYTSDGVGGQYIALDARGELPAPLYLTAGAYDIVLKTGAGATVWTRRADPIFDLEVSLLASTGSNLVGYLPAGTGAVATTVQTKLRESVSTADFGSVADWDGATGTNLNTALTLALADLPLYGGEITIPPGEYCLSSEVVVDGNADATNFSKRIKISAHGAKIYYTGSAKAFTFLDVNYPVFIGASIFLVNDTSGVFGVQLKHSRWGYYDVDIFNGITEVAAAGANNTAWLLQSGPSDTFDNLYNRINGRVRKTGWTVHLANDDTTATRNNANVFDMRYGGTNGIKIEGCEGNTFRGSLETGVGIPIALKENENAIATKYNTFDFVWVEAAGYSNWTFDVDASCIHNKFIIGNLEYGVFNMPGQDITIQGNGGTTQLISTSPRDQREFLAGIVGITSKNWILASEDFDNANWTKTTCTIAADSVASPDGATTADTLTLTAANGSASQGFSDASAGIWTASVWLKAATAHTARLRFSTDNFATNENSVTKYIYVTTDWQRFAVTLNAAGGSTGSVLINPADSDVASGAVYAWGMCVNKGYLGDYLPTGTNATPTDVGLIGHASAYPSVIPAVYFNKYVDTGVVFNNVRKIGYGTAAPTSGTHQQGDHVFNTAATVGQPKGWICSVSGTPGTWVSEGNL